MILTSSQKKIIDAAKVLYSQKGYEGTSMNAIAEYVGIRKSTLYSHFNHKEGLFRILFETILEEHKFYLKKLFNELEGKSVKKQLYFLLTNYVNQYYNNPSYEIWERFYYFPPEPMKNWILKETHEIENILRTKIRQLIIRGQKEKIICDTSVDYIMKTYYHILLGFILSRPEYYNRDIRMELIQCFKIFWDGIKIK